MPIHRRIMRDASNAAMMHSFSCNGELDAMMLSFASNSEQKVNAVFFADEDVHSQGARQTAATSLIQAQNVRPSMT